MQIIPTVELPPQPTPLLRIPKHRIEIQHLVKNPTLPNPLVHLLPRLLPLRIAIRLAREIRRRAERRDCRAENRETKGVDAGHDLRVGLRETGVDSGLGVDGRRGGTDVVYAFENEDVFDAGVGEDVALDSAQSVGSQPIGKNAIPARCKIGNGDVACTRVLLETREELVRPAVVLVGSAATTIRDGVAEEGERACRAGNPGFDGGDKVPVCCALSLWVRDGEGRRGDGVAELPPAGCATAGVGCDAVGGLAGCEVDRNGEHGLGLNLEVDGVGDGEGAVGDADVGAP